MKKIFLISIFLIFSGIGYAQSDSKVISSGDLLGNDSKEATTVRAAKLIDEGSYYYSKDAIPREVMAKLYELGLKEPIFANPKEKFQTGDVVREEGLPWRQLIVLIKDSQDNCILAYYHGGFSFHEHLLFFEVKDDKVVNFWTGMVTGQRNKDRDIVGLLREKNFQLEEYHGKIPATCQY